MSKLNVKNNVKIQLNIGLDYDGISNDILKALYPTMQLNEFKDDCSFKYMGAYVGGSNH